MLSFAPSPKPGDRTATAAPSQGPAAGCRCDLESWACPSGEILVVRVCGELDLLTRPIVAATLAQAVSDAPLHLVVDLAGLVFCCVRGFELFAETAVTAAARGIGFALSGLTAHQERVITLLSSHPGPVLHRSVAAAVSSLRTDDTHRPPSP